MKKIFTLIFSVLATLTANAQINVLDNDNVINDGGTIEVLAMEENYGDEENPFYMIAFEHDPFISNVGSSATNVSLTVTKTNKEDQLSWCLGGSCKPFNGTSMTDNITLAPGKKESIQLHPDEMSFEIGKAKTVTVKLEVSANGKSQKFTINYVYKPTSAGIEDTQAEKVTVSNNQLTYNFSNNAAHHLNIYGVSGRLVKSESLSQNGVIALNDLHRGVYIYEIVTNGKRTATHKFVIK